MDDSQYQCLYCSTRLYGPGVNPGFYALAGEVVCDRCTFEFTGDIRTAVRKRGKCILIKCGFEHPALSMACLQHKLLLKIFTFYGYEVVDEGLTKGTNWVLIRYVPKLMRRLSLPARSKLDLQMAFEELLYGVFIGDISHCHG